TRLPGRHADARLLGAPAHAPPAGLVAGVQPTGGRARLAGDRLAASVRRPGAQHDRADDLHGGDGVRGRAAGAPSSRRAAGAPKHRGISIIVVPLDAPGVEVRPLVDLMGRHHFNEVFLSDVRVPVANRVGEENRGWYVNATTMDFERSGIARIAALRRLLDRC